MKDYIKFYKYDADYQAAKPNLPEPHAVYCWETNIVDISKPIWNEKQYFALKAVDGDATLTITNTGGAAPQLWYSYNQENWTDWTAAGYPEITIVDTQKLYLKGENDQFGSSLTKYSTFGGTGKYQASGSISSLLDGDDIYGNLERSCKDYMFMSFFRNNTALTKWDVEIPYKWTSLANSCFYSFFNKCSSLTSVDFTIPYSVEKINSSCFSGLLMNCSKLTNLVIEHHPPHSTSYDCYGNWLGSVPNQASNIFRIYAEDESAWPRSTSGIPSNFTIEYLD